MPPKTLYSEDSKGKKPVTLKLIVDTESIEREINDLREIYKVEREINDLREIYKDCSDIDNEDIEMYTRSESGEKKTREEVLDEMESDIDMFVKCSEGLIRLTPKEEVINKMKAEIAGNEYKAIDWTNHFNKIPKKKDGTFAIGRIVTICEAHGFSWEDMEAYGRKGPEMVIKTFSDTEAHLIIRTGVLEKW